jgi:hypothetical protein
VVVRRLATSRPVGGREVRWTGLVGALVAAAWLLSFSPASVRGARPPAASSIGSVWPQAVRGSVSGSLPDGSTYTPRFFLDVGTSVGDSVTADGAVVRLLVVRGPDSVRELRRLPAVDAPQIFGFVAADGELAWAESTSDAAGALTTSMWVTKADGAASARRIVADAGDVRQTDSAFGLAIADGRLHWTVISAGEKSSTELRSVALDGGDARTTVVPGLWSPVGWPWLLDDSGAVSGGRVVLMDRVRQVTRAVVAGQAEFPECGATWCRVIVLDDAGSGRIDLLRVDGTQRRRIAGADDGFPVTDVAVLDRFEIMTAFSPTLRPGLGRPLSIYDITRDNAVAVTANAVTVVSRGGFLWWSSGFEDRVSWSVVDLRTLS